MWFKVARSALAMAALVTLLLAVGSTEALAQARKSDSVVKITATPEKPGPDGKQVINLTLAIDKGWHTYANPVGNPSLTTAQTRVTVEGKTAPNEVHIVYPEGESFKDQPTGELMNIYEGDVTIKAIVQRTSGDSPLKLKVKIQSCTGTTCLLPATVEVSVP